MTADCFYFGCWGCPGHYLHIPGGRDYARDESCCVYYGQPGNQRHLDGSLAPRRMRDGSVIWSGSGDTEERRRRLRYDSEELDEGQFLRHELDNGFTAIQWWDRHQGDGRGACNSTILLRGSHTSEEMLAALAQHFPQVLARLTAAGIALVEVKT